MISDLGFLYTTDSFQADHEIDLTKIAKNTGKLEYIAYLLGGANPMENLGSYAKDLNEDMENMDKNKAVQSLLYCRLV